VNTYKRTDNHETDWQILGELELPVGLSVDDKIHTWLTEILSPLNLSTEFFERFLKSAQASASHAMGAKGSVQLGQVHISILMLQVHSLVGKSWGFFQIERIDNKADDVDAHEHAIDFYLYVEGD